MGSNSINIKDLDLDFELDGIPPTEYVSVDITLHKDTIKRLSEIGEESLTSTNDLIVLAVDEFVFKHTV